MLQRNMYLQEVERASISLTKIDATLGKFEFFGSLIHQVKLLLQEVANKDKVLASISV